MSKQISRFWWVVVVLGLAAFVAYSRTRPRVVDVVLPVERTVVESIAAAGRVRGQVETSVGAQTSGRVALVPVREGDMVKAGQVVARLDDTVLQAQVAQAENAVITAEALLQQADDAIQTAQAQLVQASRKPLPSDVARLKADTAQNVAVAEAKLAGTKQRLVELKEGATPEERQQLTAQVEQATANVEQAERDYTRQNALVEQGAASKNTLDSADTARKVARKTLENLLARQKQQEIGTRPEQIAQAEAEVRAALATVAGVRASGNAQLISLLATPRPEDVLVARQRLAETRGAKAVAVARLREARVALSVARSRLADALVTAPFDGTITQIVTEAGGVTGPNQPIVRLVRFSRPEIRIDADEIHLGKIFVGQSAVVSSDAFPNQTFEATVREIGAQVDAERGTVETRLNPVNPPAWLRPGQTVSVNLIVDKGTQRLVLPLTTVTTVGGVSSVLLVENGKVARKEITVGPPGPDGIPVLEGLNAQSQVLRPAPGLAVGQVVAAKPLTKGEGQ